MEGFGKRREAGKTKSNISVKFWEAHHPFNVLPSDFFLSLRQYLKDMYVAVATNTNFAVISDQKSFACTDNLGVCILQSRKRRRYRA
jgi:hypothetical protein